MTLQYIFKKCKFDRD